MNHYFTTNSDLESQKKDIYFNIRETQFHFITDNGVFSKSRLDFGSRLLIESVIDNKKDKVLDLGSGYGPIGIVYKKFNPDSEVTLLDVNQRAIDLSGENAKLNNLTINIKVSDGYDKINSDFSLIISNPPIRAGKDLLFSLLKDSYDHLLDGGELVFVIHKNLGAMSAKAFCEGIYKKVDVINKKSGYLIIKCIK